MVETQGKIRVALNGYGVIGKRGADAVACQDDMELVGIADIATDWRRERGPICVVPTLPDET